MILSMSELILFKEAYNFFSIFQVWKGFAQRRQTKRERDEEMIFIGMVGQSISALSMSQHTNTTKPARPVNLSAVRASLRRVYSL